MKTKHRYEFRTFTVEKENGWVGEERQDIR